MFIKLLKSNFLKPILFKAIGSTFLMTFLNIRASLMLQNNSKEQNENFSLSKIILSEFTIKLLYSIGIQICCAISYNLFLLNSFWCTAPYLYAALRIGYDTYKDINKDNDTKSHKPIFHTTNLFLAVGTGIAVIGYSLDNNFRDIFNVNDIKNVSNVVSISN
ncbi:MAG: hypothetical protein J0H68_04745 [Sphingobacteriia bacterium]|nr:hypothetical protein [Sphingobacteriia bacterium]